MNEHKPTSAQPVKQSREPLWGPGDILILRAELRISLLYRVDPITGAQIKVTSFEENKGLPVLFALEADYNILVIVLVTHMQGIGGTGEVIRVDRFTGKQTRVSSGNPPHVNPSSSIAGVAMEADGKILILGPEGLDRVDLETGTQTKVSSGDKFVEPAGLAVDRVTGSIFVADRLMRGGGVIRVDPASGVQTVVASGGLLAGSNDVFGHEEGPHDVAIEADGHILALRSFSTNPFDRGCQIIRVHPGSGEQTDVVGSHGDVLDSMCMAVEDDGTILLIGSRGLIRVDPRSKTLTTLSFDPGYAIAVVPLLLAKAICSGPVTRVALSTAGIRLVATASDSMASLFNVDNTDKPLLARPAGVLTSIVFSPDGGHFVTGSTDGVRLFSTVSGKPVKLEHGAVNAVAISPGAGEWVASASNDKTARVVRRDNGQERWRCPHPSGVKQIAFSSDGRWVATGAGRATRILDAEDGNELHRIDHDGMVKALAFRPVGSLLATANEDGMVLVIDASTGEQHDPIAHPQAVTTVAFSSDGSLLATGGLDGAVRVFSLTEGSSVLRHELTYDSPVTLVGFQAAGPGLAIATEGPVVRIVNPTNGEERRLIHPAPVRHFAFDAEGNLLATACDDKTARVYALRSPESRAGGLNRPSTAMLP